MAFPIVLLFISYVGLLLCKMGATKVTFCSWLLHHLCTILLSIFLFCLHDGITSVFLNYAVCFTGWNWYICIGDLWQKFLYVGCGMWLGNFTITVYRFFGFCVINFHFVVNVWKYFNSQWCTPCLDNVTYLIFCNLKKVEPTIVILGTQYSHNPNFYKHLKYCLKPHTYLVTAPCGFRRCKNRHTPFPGWMS